MKLIKILFYNYYHFQQKTGNGDICIFMAFVMILFSSYLYLTSIGMLLELFIPSLELSIMVILETVLTIGIGGAVYRIVVWKKQYERIVQQTQFGALKYKIISVIFFCSPIVLLIATFILMWAKNNHFI